MNSKALRTLIYLFWFSMLFSSVLKIFFTESFVLVVSNDKLVQVGEWIDSHAFIEQILLFGLSYFVYFTFICACKQQWNLSIKEHIVLLFSNTCLSLLSLADPSVGTFADTCVMVLLPCVFKADYKQFTTVFIAHYIGEIILLSIRTKPALLLGVDFATQFVLALDVYIWLLLYYSYSNLYKEKPLWEELLLRCSEISQKLSLKKSSRKSEDR